MCTCSDYKGKINGCDPWDKHMKREDKEYGKGQAANKTERIRPSESRDRNWEKQKCCFWDIFNIYFKNLPMIENKAER